MPDSCRIIARYWIETGHSIEAAAAAMAGEQSSGTFVPVPGETAELKARHGAQVLAIEPLGEVAAPSLPGAHPPKSGSIKLQQALVALAFPMDNVGDSLTALWTMLSGNLYELGYFSGLRLLDFEVPYEFAQVQAGPAFGIEGTRRLTGVQSGPILGTIIKPSVGLSPEATADLAAILCEAGLDFIKDDELIANPPYSPLADRVEKVMRVINNHADRTGQKVMYAFNITDTPEAMKRHHDTVLQAGGTCVMYNLVGGGLAGLQSLRAHGALPIHGHRAGWGMLTRCPALGMEYVAWQKFFRMAGTDQMHVNGIRNKFCESDESVVASARACQTPIHGRHTVLPVFSSGQTVEQSPDTWQLLGNADLMYLAGGGIMAHPDGPAEGVSALRQSWDAARRGIPLATHALTHTALARALACFKK